MIVEVIVGFAVAVLGMIAILQLSNRSMGNAGVAERQALATRYANEGLDWVKGQVVELGWTAFLAYSTPAGPWPPSTYCLNAFGWTAVGDCAAGTVITNTEFTRTLYMSYSTDAVTGKNLVWASVMVTWMEDGRPGVVNREYEFVPY